MEKRKEKSDQNSVAELTREGLYKENKWLWEENRKLKEDNRFLTKISKEYMEKENIIQVTEFTQLYKDDLEKENENLKAIIDHYKKFEEGKEKLEGMLMEEDTLQELRDLGKI